MEKKKLFISLIVGLLLLSSCSSRKNFVYLQDMKEGIGYVSQLKYEAVIHKDDRLGIVVSSKNPELAIPFNIKGGTFHMSSDGNISTSTETSSGANDKGYRVDVEGYIDFPILGKLKVEGLTVNQATELIRKKIIEGNYIKEPLVSIEFLNFKYTVLGAVGNTGTFTVDGDKITLLDAIARAGDLGSKAKINGVTVIRETGNERRIYVHDLRSKDLFNSPAYYLQQNDIVYVEPKYKKKDSEDKSLQYGTLFLSVVTAVCSVIWATK